MVWAALSQGFEELQHGQRVFTALSFGSHLQGNFTGRLGAPRPKASQHLAVGDWANHRPNIGKNRRGRGAEQGSDRHNGEEAVRPHE
jgi:hypothetical protein